MRFAIFACFLIMSILLLNSNPPQSATVQDPCWELQPWVIDELTCNDIPKPVDTLALLLDAMIQVESRGNDSAYAKSENAVGCLQIRPVMVREVNRFLKKLGKEKRYTLEDRWSRDKSLEMFNIWYRYRHDDSSLEVIARSWNGGPRGPKKKSTLYYWSKVQKEYKLTCDELDS